jgi:hypothetical protein
MKMGDWLGLPPCLAFIILVALGLIQLDDDSSLMTAS